MATCHGRCNKPGGSTRQFLCAEALRTDASAWQARQSDADWARAADGKTRMISERADRMTRGSTGSSGWHKTAND